MPEIAFVEIDGVEEEEYFSNVKGQEGKLLVLQFDHDVSKEVDPLDCSKVRSDRHHGAASILTYQGKSTPELNKLLCEGGTIGQIQIKWYRQPEGSSGNPEHYFTHTFKDCIITAVRPAMSQCPGRRGLRSYAELHLRLQAADLDVRDWRHRVHRRGSPVIRPHGPVSPIGGLVQPEVRQWWRGTGERLMAVLCRWLTIPLAILWAGR